VPRVFVIRRRLAGLALGIALFQGGFAKAADGLVVHAEPRGPAVAIDVRATVAAPHALIWSTLTDYGHLAEFIPGMQSSKITERRGATAIVEQRGEAGFMVFSYGIDVVWLQRSITPTPLKSVCSRAISSVLMAVIRWSAVRRKAPGS